MPYTAPVQRKERNEMKISIVIMFSAVLAAGLSAQTENGSGVYMFPHDTGSPDNSDAKNDLDTYRLYINPIGWSPRGLFAYQTGFYNGHFSGTKLVIYDTVEDKLIEESYVTTYAPGEETIIDYDEKLLTWNTILKKYQINKLLGTFPKDIEPAGIRAFPLRHNSRDLSCWFEYRTATPGEETKLAWDLFAGDAAIRKKISSGEEYSYTFSGAKILGYLKSPFEERIVIITVFRDGGFENEFWKTLHLYGCHLNAGFTRRNNESGLTK
jgi:hypothetical protein